MSTQDAQQISIQISKLHTQIAVMQNDIGWIRKEIEGNGKPGILKRLCKLEDAHNADSGSDSQRKISWERISIVIMAITAVSAVVVAIIK